MLKLNRELNIKLMPIEEAAAITKEVFDSLKQETVPLGIVVYATFKEKTNNLKG